MLAVDAPIVEPRLQCIAEGSEHILSMLRHPGVAVNLVGGSDIAEPELVCVPQAVLSDLDCCDGFFHRLVAGIGPQ